MEKIKKTPVRFDFQKRILLEKYLKENIPITKIAREFGMDPSTIHLELIRCEKGNYCAEYAQKDAELKAKTYKKKNNRMTLEDREKIEAGIKKGLSIREIANSIDYSITSLRAEINNFEKRENYCAKTRHEQVMARKREYYNIFCLKDEIDAIKMQLEIIFEMLEKGKKDE